MGRNEERGAAGVSVQGGQVAPTAWARRVGALPLGALPYPRLAVSLNADAREGKSLPQQSRVAPLCRPQTRRSPHPRTCDPRADGARRRARGPCSTARPVAANRARKREARRVVPARALVRPPGWLPRHGILTGPLHTPLATPTQAAVYTHRVHHPAMHAQAACGRASRTPGSSSHRRKRHCLHETRNSSRASPERRPQQPPHGHGASFCMQCVT